MKCASCGGLVIWHGNFLRDTVCTMCGAVNNQDLQRNATDMLEKVARTILRHCTQRGIELDCCSRNTPEHIATDIARAVIRAMDEPTEGMVNAADKHVYYEGGFGTDLDAVWKTMIDAALEEGK